MGAVCCWRDIPYERTWHIKFVYTFIGFRLAHVSFRPENDEFEHEFQLFALICHTFPEFTVGSLKYVHSLVVTALEARDGVMSW